MSMRMLSSCLQIACETLFLIVNQIAYILFILMKCVCAKCVWLEHRHSFVCFAYYSLLIMSLVVFLLVRSNLIVQLENKLSGGILLKAPLSKVHNSLFNYI